MLTSIIEAMLLDILDVFLYLVKRLNYECSFAFTKITANKIGLLVIEVNCI